MGRLHARAARHVYRMVREDGGAVPWLAIAIIAAGFGAGFVADEIMHALEWTAPDSSRGVMWGLILTCGWVLFAIIAGGGYGPEDT